MTRFTEGQVKGAVRMTNQAATPGCGVRKNFPESDIWAGDMKGE